VGKRGEESGGTGKERKKEKGWEGEQWIGEERCTPYE